MIGKKPISSGIFQPLEMQRLAAHRICSLIIAMPTIHRENGFRFFFFSNENDENPHVHVEKSGGAAKLNLLEKIYFIWVRRFSKPDQSRILKITELH